MGESAPGPRLTTDERRTQLLDLGLELFSESAFDVVSIDRIAARAGVSRGLLYHYFPSKRAFYVALVEHAGDLLFEGTDAAPDAPLAERVTRSMDAFIDLLEHRRGLYLMVLSGGVGTDPEVREVTRRTRDRFVERMAGRIEQHTAGGPLLRTALQGYFGFTEAAALRWIERREVSREELLTLSTEVMLSILARPGVLAADRPI